MDQIFTMFDDLQTCYNLKVPSNEAYNTLSETEKNSICLKLRQNITKLLNSDEVLFENYLNKEIEKIKSNLIFFNLKMILLTKGILEQYLRITKNKNIEIRNRII